MLSRIGHRAATAAALSSSYAFATATASFAPARVPSFFFSESAGKTRVPLTTPVTSVSSDYTATFRTSSPVSAASGGAASSTSGLDVSSTSVAVAAAAAALREGVSATEALDGHDIEVLTRQHISARAARAAELEVDTARAHGLAHASASALSLGGRSGDADNFVSSLTGGEIDAEVTDVEVAHAEAAEAAAAAAAADAGLVAWPEYAELKKASDAAAAATTPVSAVYTEMNRQRIYSEYAAGVRRHRQRLRGAIVAAYHAQRQRPRFVMSSIIAVLEAIEYPNVALYGLRITPSAAGYDAAASSRMLVYATCPNEEILFLTADVLSRLALDHGVVATPASTFTVAGADTDPWVMVDLGSVAVHLSMPGARGVDGAETLLHRERVGPADYERFAAGLGDNVPLTRCTLISRVAARQARSKERNFTVQTLLREINAGGAAQTAKDVGRVVVGAPAEQVIEEIRAETLQRR
jgi:hypothetical protein